MYWRIYLIFWEKWRIYLNSSISWNFVTNRNCKKCPYSWIYYWRRCLWENKCCHEQSTIKPSTKCLWRLKISCWIFILLKYMKWNYITTKNNSRKINWYHYQDSNIYHYRYIYIIFFGSDQYCYIHPKKFKESKQ